MITKNENMAKRIVREADRRGLLDQSFDSAYSAETNAANWSIASQLYVSLQPSAYATIPASACDDIRSGQSQCCRVGEDSLCACGHPLSTHESCKIPKRPGYIKPPKCSACKRCTGFTYLPMYPEECGQWWLRRRRDFNIVDWRRRVRTNPEEYACIGCNLKLSDHETLFETKEMRAHRGAPVDDSYIPLNDYRTERAALSGSDDHDSMPSQHLTDCTGSSAVRGQRYGGVGK